MLMKTMPLLTILALSVFAVSSTLAADFLEKMADDNAKRESDAEKERKKVDRMQEEIHKYVRDTVKRMQKEQADSQKSREKQDKAMAKLNKRIARSTKEFEKLQLEQDTEIAKLNKRIATQKKDIEMLQLDVAPQPGGEVAK